MNPSILSYVTVDRIIGQSTHMTCMKNDQQQNVSNQVTGVARGLVVKCLTHNPGVMDW